MTHISHPSANLGRGWSPLLMLCGGGTGGHVYPALAVADALRTITSLAVSPSATRWAEPGANQPPNANVVSAFPPLDVANPAPASASSNAAWPIINDPASAAKPRLLYVGSVGGMEGALVARESDLPFVALPAAAMRGRNPLAMAKNALVLARGVAAARRLIRQERPAAILGTGGYVCVPLFVAAALEKIPTLLYLPDIVPGWAGRVLARLATRIAVTFDDSKRYLPADKVIVTGYPVRTAVFGQDKAACRRAFGLGDERPVVLVYGGSRGARSINRAIAALLPHLVQWADIIHVCGREGDEIWLHAARAQLEPELAARYHLFPYLHADDARSMAVAFGAADLAVCRAGASTMAELPAAGIGAILIPLTAVKQEFNADALAGRGAAISIADDAMLGTGEPTAGPLWRELHRLLTDSSARQTLAARSASLAQPDAGARLASEWLSLARGGRFDG